MGLRFDQLPLAVPSSTADILAVMQSGVTRQITLPSLLVNMLLPTITFGGSLSGTTLNSDIIIDHTTTLPANAQASLVYNNGVYTNLSNDGEGVVGFHATLTAASGSISSSNMHGGIFTVRNSGPGETKGAYARANALTGSTGNVVGLVAAVVPASTTNVSAGVQVSMNSSGTGGDGVGQTVSNGVWLISDSGTCSITNGFVLDSTVAVVSGGAAFKAFAVGSGALIELKNSNGSQDLFRVNSAGAITTNAAIGGASISSTTALNLPASTTGVSSIRLAHGAAPSSPVNGDMWTTSSGLFVQINGSPVGPLS